MNIKYINDNHYNNVIAMEILVGDPNKILDEYGNTSLMIAAKNCVNVTYMNHLRSMLEDDKTDVNMRAKNGLTALMMSCRDFQESQQTQTIKHRKKTERERKKERESWEEVIKMLVANPKTNLFIKDRDDNGLDILHHPFSWGCRTLLKAEVYRRQIKWQIKIAQQFSRQTIISKDIWLMILLRNMLEKLKYSHDCFSKQYFGLNINISKFVVFAQELNIPVKSTDTAEMLYYKISEVLSGGTSYNCANKSYIVNRSLNAKKAVTELMYKAQRLNIHIERKKLFDVCKELSTIASIDWEEEYLKPSSDPSVKII